MAGNIADLFTQHLSRPDAILYRHSTDRGWQDVTVNDLAREIGRWQAAFRREDLLPGDRIAICARNGPSWVAADLAALGLGFVVVPLYVDDNPENIAWCIDNAEAKIAIIENLRLAHGVRKCVTTPLRIVVMRGEEDAAVPDGARTLDTFLPLAVSEVNIRALPANALATICYTSGTSGRPKGVMLSHANILSNVEACRATNMARSTDRFLSILPLSHMFERTGGYYLPLSLGALVVHSRGIARIAEDFISAAPTVIFAVPRIFERTASRIESELAKSAWKKALFDRCVAVGNRIAQRKASPLEQLFGAALRALVAKPILQKLGGKMRLAVVGGAAFDPKIARMFAGLGLTLLQGYGLTEASPVIAVNRDDDNDPESVGPPVPGVEVRISPEKELLARGPNVMQGYWRDEEATYASIDSDGWLHTGDLAEIINTKIYIRGRAKDILVMSNGEKLSPQDVELAILHDATFEQVMLIGEARPYPVLLAVTQESDEKSLVRKANEQLKSFPRWIRVRHVIATPEAWSVENGLLTPTLKLRRPAVVERFNRAIEAAYSAIPLD